VILLPAHGITNEYTKTYFNDTATDSEENLSKLLNGKFDFFSYRNFYTSRHIMCAVSNECMKQGKRVCYQTGDEVLEDDNNDNDSDII